MSTREKKCEARLLLCHLTASAKPVLDIAVSEHNLIGLPSKPYRPVTLSSFRNRVIPADFAYAVFFVDPDWFHCTSPAREGAFAGPMDPLAGMVGELIQETVAQPHSASVDRERQRG
jgi:hypothetical protein